MNKKTAIAIFFMLFLIVSCGKEKQNVELLKTLDFKVSCKPSNYEFIADFYIDTSFVGSTKVSCSDGYTLFSVHLNKGIHNIMIFNKNVSLYKKNIKIFETEPYQNIAVDFQMK